MALLVVVAVRLAHIPRGVLPSVPRWLWFCCCSGR